jgi:hypothetical protein
LQQAFELDADQIFQNFRLAGSHRGFRIQDSVLFIFKGWAIYCPLVLPTYLRFIS